MSTFADIQKSATGIMSTYIDDYTPAGHFAATTTVLGIVTTYLLRGELNDREALIVGRGEIIGRRQTCYLGGGIKGGEWVGGTLRDLFARFEPDATG